MFGTGTGEEFQAYDLLPSSDGKTVQMLLTGSTAASIPDVGTYTGPNPEPYSNFNNSEAGWIAGRTFTYSSTTFGTWSKTPWHRSVRIDQSVTL